MTRISEVGERSDRRLPRGRARATRGPLASLALSSWGKRQGLLIRWGLKRVDPQLVDQARGRLLQTQNPLGLIQKLSCHVPPG